MAAVKFSTFAPGKAPAGQKSSEVKLKPGQTLHFQKGKGYYAGPASPSFDPTTPGGRPNLPAFAPAAAPVARRVNVPHPPVDPFAALSAGAIDRRASSIASSDVLPQQQELQRQQALAAQQAQEQQAAISGFGTAAGTLLQGIAPQVTDAYGRAVAEQGALGQGLATGVGQDVAAQQAQDQAFAASQGQQTQDTTSVPALHDSVQMLNGVIPGSELAAHGAAAATEAAQAPQISLDATREQLAQAFADAHVRNDSFAKQLIDLAATEPGLKAQALQQLNQYELDKANYRQSVANSRADNARQDRALHDNEVAAGLTGRAAAAKLNAEYTYKYAALAFKSKEDAAKAAAAGKIIDPAASRVLGHVVYKDGSENPAIKVKQTVAKTPQQKAVANRAKATSTASVNAFKYATKILGKPTPNPQYGKGILAGKGRFIASPKYAAIKQGTYGAVFPPSVPGGPATTNNPARAARTGAGATDYADAQTKVWAEIDGDGLMSRYGYSRAQVTAIVNRALRAAGWQQK